MWMSLSVLLAAAVLTASCGASSSNTTSAAAPGTASGPVVLTVTSGSKVKSYSLADLQRLKVVTGNGGMKGKAGAVTGPFAYKGVALTDLLNAVGGVAAGQSVKLTGTDGYTKTLTYDQVTSGGFATYDATGNPVTPAAKPILAVVYSSNGAALDSTVGPIEFGLLSDQNLVSDGSSWVKLLESVDIIPAQ